MKNIGIVIYKKDNETGELTAQWDHSDYGPGTGIAKAITSNGFEGVYKIQYFYNNGDLQAERDLTIKKCKENYHLYWSKDGKVTSEGIGIEISQHLYTGYHDL